jgi:hypothetical protein
MSWSIILANISNVSLYESNKFDRLSNCVDACERKNDSESFAIPNSNDWYRSSCPMTSSFNDTLLNNIDLTVFHSQMLTLSEIIDHCYSLRINKRYFFTCRVCHWNDQQLLLLLDDGSERTWDAADLTWIHFHIVTMIVKCKCSTYFYQYHFTIDMSNQTEKKKAARTTL